MPTVTESVVEEAALEILRELGYTVVYGPSIAPGEPQAERTHYHEVLLVGRLEAALRRLNPQLPAAALDEAKRKVLHLPSPSLLANNRLFHRMLADGVEVEYSNGEGRVIGDRVRLIDPEHPAANDWLAVNQFTVTEGQINRRPDIVLFVNGLPLAVIELKNPADEEATLETAYHQLQTYKAQIPGLFLYNEFLAISDGLFARVGTLTSDWERFMPWRTIDDEKPAPAGLPQLEVLLRGAFAPTHILEMARHFIVFEDPGNGRVQKKLAAYHQFHAVRQAVEATVTAAGAEGDRRCGVVWHTQGSGKSLTMVFYAGRLALHPQMENPTLVVITDRNDLDGQLFGTFSRCADLLRQHPVQAESREQLQSLLQVASGGIVFTTIQKFLPEKGEAYPLLSDRRNIVVIADEAHRTQYDFIDGFARHLRDALPGASFIGFTGTPVEQNDRNTRAVFGRYISIYDIRRAVEDGATVPIYYESRIAQLDLNEAELPKIDPEFDEVTEGEEIERKERLKSRWSQLEAIVGTDRRLQEVAQDLVKHFEERLTAMEGKAMIVCMSRRICVALYQALIALRPEWHSEDDAAGVLKIVMTGSASDPAGWQNHIRNKARREALGNRFKDPADPLKLVIVRDMWLTGFDAPCLHTLYIDKPMQGHGLMQAIARVNRVFKDKPGGLVVDYIGLAEPLRQALALYTESGGAGDPTLDPELAVAVLLEKYEICRDLFHGFDRTPWTTATNREQLALIAAGADHILGIEPDGPARFKATVTSLSRAFALAPTHPKAQALRDEIAFFQCVKAALAKLSGTGGKLGADLDYAIRQIVSKAVAPEGVVDLFAAAGLKRPDLSIFSDEFLEEVSRIPHRNLAVELLRKLLSDAIHQQGKKNLMLARSFAEMLERTLRAYQNRTLETEQIIAALAEMAHDIRQAGERGEKLGLNDDELAFYDALEANDSAVQVLGDEKLTVIARELVTAVRRNVTIDWTVKESVRANLRRLVKRILNRHGYPPDRQERATLTVLAQAEVLCAEWAG